jgi:hypothetical protein
MQTPPTSQPQPEPQFYHPGTGFNYGRQQGMATAASEPMPFGLPQGYAATPGPASGPNGSTATTQYANPQYANPQYTPPTPGFATFQPVQSPPFHLQTVQSPPQWSAV